jgi:hypothetical protein
LQSGRVTQDQRKDLLQADAATSVEMVTDYPQPSGTPSAEAEATAGAMGKLPPWPSFDPFEEAARRAEAQGRIDKSQLALSEPRRERDPEHLKRVGTRPCLICGRNRAQAHHLTYLQPRAMGRKVSDEFTVPLCSTHHQELHGSGNEKAWWAEQGIDPEPLAKALWGESRRSPRRTTGETIATKVARPKAQS